MVSIPIKNCKNMKKIFFLIALFFAFSFNVSAQEKQEITPQAQAKLDATKVTEFLKLDKAISDSLYQLFEMKYTILSDKLLTTERKNEFSKVVEAKLRATFTGEQMKVLESQKDLYEHLIK